MFFFTFLLCCVDYTVLAQQQGNITGKVTLGASDPASGVTVIIKNRAGITITDTDGSFTIRGVPYGKYILEFSSVEAESHTLEILVNAPVYNIKVLLKKAKTTELDEVVVRHKTQKQEITEKGFAVNVIETKEASLRNIQTNELLDRTAGVRIRQDGGLGSHIHYNINGMTGNAVKIFIDGIPAANYGQSFSLNSIPPAMIERIEVYKGVVPGYLSDDALGGAINVVLKQSKKNHLNASYSYGSFNTHQFNMNGGFSTEKGFVFNISGFYNYSDNNYKVWGEEITFRNHQGVVTPNQEAKRFHDAFRSYGTKVEMGWSRVKWADRFTIGGVFSDDYKEVQNGVTMQRTFGDRHFRRNAGIATVNYLKKDLFTEGLSLKVDASFSRLRTQVIDSAGIMYDWRGPILYPDGTPVRYSGGAELGNRKTAVINTDKTFMVRANLGYRIDSANSVYINYLFNNFGRGTSDAFLPAGLQLLQDTRDLQKSIATFTYENLSFAGKLRTNVFYKYYHQQVTANRPYQVTANPATYDVAKEYKTEKYHGFGGALSFALSSKVYILGSAERAIRFPNEREIFGNPAALVNPGNVRAEESFNANIGINLGKYTFNRHSIRLNTSVFYRDTKGMIREAITPGNSGTSYYENLEDVLTKGIDAELIYNYAEKLNFTFNISKFDVLFNTEYNKEGARYLYYRQQIRNEPSFKYNAGAVYFFNNLFFKNSKASLYYHIGYVKGFRRNWSNVGLTNLDNIPTQLFNDIGFMFTPPGGKITFSFDAKDIFNRQLYDNFGLQKPGRAFFGKITLAII